MSLVKTLTTLKQEFENNRKTTENTQFVTPDFYTDYVLDVLVPSLEIYNEPPDISADELKSGMLFLAENLREERKKLQDLDRYKLMAHGIMQDSKSQDELLKISNIAIDKKTKYILDTTSKLLDLCIEYAYTCSEI